MLNKRFTSLPLGLRSLIVAISENLFIISPSIDTRKCVFGICDQVRLKRVFSAAETSYGPEILDLTSKYRYYAILVANMAL